MCALLFGTYPPFEIVIAADDIKAKSTQKILKALNSIYCPNKIVIFREGKVDAPAPEICKIAKFAAEQKPIDGKPTAYVCEHFTCQAPTADPAQLSRLLQP